LKAFVAMTITTIAAKAKVPQNTQMITRSVLT